MLISMFSIGLRTNVIKLPIQRTIEVQFIPGLEDDRIMMGVAHNVFVGTVIKQVGNADTGLGVSTQFEVAVVYNVKGSLSGTVTVDQQGGYENGILYLVEDDPMLQQGSTYLLTTRYDEQQRWYTVSAHPNGRKLISQDQNLRSDQLLQLSQQDSKVRLLQEAYKKEILLDVDIKTRNTRNSYQSTQKQ